MSHLISKLSAGSAPPIDGPEPAISSPGGRHRNPLPSRRLGGGPSAPPAEVLTGTIFRINQEKGFGFIRGADGFDYYMHVSSAVSRKVWFEGAVVSFTPGHAEPGSRKCPPAFDVSLVDPKQSHPAPGKDGL